MHHYNNAHEGHTEHCCLCIPTNVGGHILGTFAVLSTISSVYNVITLTASTPAASNPFIAQILGAAAAFVSVGYLVSALLTGYPAVMYLLMLKHNNEDSRKHFAKAYKIMVQISNVLVLIAAISLLATSIWAFSKTGANATLSPAIVSVVVFPIVIFVNLHYNRVVQTFAAHGEGHGHTHHDGYEKH